MAPKPERIKIRSFGGEWEFIALTKKGTPRKTAPRVGEPLRLGLVRKFDEVLTRGSSSSVTVTREELWNLGSVQVAQKDSLIRLNKSVSDIKGPKVIFYESRGAEVPRLDKDGKKIPLYDIEVVTDDQGRYQYETVTEEVKDPKTGRKKKVQVKRRITKKTKRRDENGKIMYQTRLLFGSYTGPDKRLKTRPVLFDAETNEIRILRFPFYKENVHEQILNRAIITKKHSTTITLNLMPEYGESVASQFGYAVIEFPDYQPGDRLQVRSQFTMPNGSKSGFNITVEDLSSFVNKTSSAIVASFARYGYRFTDLRTLRDFGDEYNNDPESLMGTKYTLEQGNAFGEDLGTKITREELLEIDHMDALNIEVTNLSHLERQSGKVPKKRRGPKKRRFR